MSVSNLIESNEKLECFKTAIENAASLKSLVLVVFSLSIVIARMFIEEILSERASQSIEQPVCPVCGRQMTSKGMLPRSMMTLVGKISWKRKVFRCPKGCAGVLTALFDEELKILPNQRTGNELKKMACSLAVFVPFGIASSLLKVLTGVEICPQSICSWVQYFGSQAMMNVEEELQNSGAGNDPAVSGMEPEISQLPICIGGDGVKVPFRPNACKPEGKTDWKEVKVGIVARLKKFVTRKGKEGTCIVRRRVTAVLGTVDEFKSRIRMTSVKEGVLESANTVWLSDGGPGFWGVFKELYSGRAKGVLDFYHAAQNIAKGAKALFDEGTEECQRFFELVRGALRHEDAESAIDLIEAASLFIEGLTDSENKIVENLISYLMGHIEHMEYVKFKEMGLPIGSGIVESACKWLIQQRFKCVGMRWGQKGFNNLLHLRLFWVNEEFDELFE